MLSSIARISNVADLFEAFLSREIGKIRGVRKVFMGWASSRDLKSFLIYSIDKIYSNSILKGFSWSMISWFHSVKADKHVIPIWQLISVDCFSRESLEISYQSFLIKIVKEICLQDVSWEELLLSCCSLLLKQSHGWLADRTSNICSQNIFNAFFSASYFCLFYEHTCVFSSVLVFFSFLYFLVLTWRRCS